MTAIKKYANVIERFLHGEKGQRFFNFAYSIGAAIVIWGALFKILHLPGGSTLLCIGMGTEIAMFILTAFDRPPKDYAWEEVFPVLDSHDPAERPSFRPGEGVTMGSGFPEQEYSVASTNPNVEVVPSQSANQTVQASPMADVVVDAAQGESQLNSYPEVSFPEFPTFPDADGLSEASRIYVEQMQEIATRMTELNETYATQMQDLNRNVGGLNTIYEIQLKSISSQLATIDRVNNGLKDIRDMYEKSARDSAAYCEETEKMARYMRQLNAVYEKMITAMTINMQNPMMGAAVSQNPSPFNTPEE